MTKMEIHFKTPPPEGTKYRADTVKTITIPLGKGREITVFAQVNKAVVRKKNNKEKNGKKK